jgi:hypothetical protein
LLLLLFALPFDMDGKKLVWTLSLTVTNLTVLILAVAVIALITVGDLAIDALQGSATARKYFRGRRVPLALLAAFVVSCSISTLAAQRSTQGATWFLTVLAGALLWLALPLWLGGDTEEKIRQVCAAIVAGAVVASAVGIVEIGAGADFERHLSVFKFGPDVLGPFLRLSATFSSANVAAMYFELALPFALAGVIEGLTLKSRGWPALLVWWTCADLIFLTLVHTYSRGAILGLLASGVAMGLAARAALRLRNARDSWRLIALSAGNLVLVAGIITFSTSSLQILRLTTRDDRAWFEASYVSKVPATLPAGRSRLIPVTVENRSPLTWDGSRRHSYGLSYHWLYPSRRVVRFANNIAWLGFDVAPGARELVDARVMAPSAPGTYLLAWDMVWEGTTWFAPRTGSYQVSEVRVVPTKSGAGAAGRLATPDIDYLPTNPALGRRQIWSAAISMIERRPLFGVGPQGVRMNYTAFVPPDPTAPSRPPPPHAHDLVLEMLADWGLIGGGIFLALLTVLWWPLVVRVWGGHVTIGWEMAVIGAAAALLGHQLVDFFLTKQAILVFFWLLSGMAAVMSTKDSAVQQRATKERLSGGLPEG